MRFLGGVSLMPRVAAGLFVNMQMRGACCARGGPGVFTHAL